MATGKREHIERELRAALVIHARLVAKFCGRCRRKLDAYAFSRHELIDTIVRLERVKPGVRAIQLTADDGTTTPEDTLREAGISSKRQTQYQRRMSSLLAGRA